MTHSEKLTHLNQQINRLTRRIDVISGKSNNIATWRLLVGFGGGGLLFFAIFLPTPIYFWVVLAVLAVAFVVLIAEHRKVEHSLKRHRIWRQIKQENRARLLLDWQRIPKSKLTMPHHPLEVDLDLRELHQLLDTSSSYDGSARLREWFLSDEPYLQNIEQRQSLVRELVQRPAYRNKLTLHARLSPSQIHKQLQSSWLNEWLQSDVDLPKVNFWLMILTVLSVAHIIGFVLLQFDMISTTIAGTLWGIYALVYVSRVGLLTSMSGDSQQLYDVLLRLRSIMQHLESYPYATLPNLRKLCSPLLEAKPSKEIKNLMGTLAAGSLRGNPPLWILLNAILPWDMIFMRRLHIQKQTLTTYMPQWLDIWHEVEALNSLATFADLQSGATMPTLEKSTVFEAVNIGHPLITPENRVSNDFAIHQVGDVAILTGSNMSGKSSFLRTLGVNLVLAYAGGVVIADSLNAGVFRLFSCVRVTDSLDDGISYFYAEVRRLRALLNALEVEHELPLFFVIDEIFRGTNNRERLIGSRSYINALVGGNGVGLIATHDLELTQLADGNPNVRNLHFREHVADGRMVFDYTLREGASPTTNALQIMAMEGLPVDDEAFKQATKS